MKKCKRGRWNKSSLSKIKYKMKMKNDKTISKIKRKNYIFPGSVPNIYTVNTTKQ